MASRDLHNRIALKAGIEPAAANTGNTPWVSEIVDTQGYESVEFVILNGSLADADATFAVLFEDGDAANMSDHAEVDAKYLLGTEALASFTYAADNKVFKIGYRGIKRYCRVTITPSANSTDAYVAGVWVLGNPHSAPTANPPA